MKLEEEEIKMSETAMLKEGEQFQYDAWIQSRSIAIAYRNAAEALLEEARVAFSRGNDEIAFLLRERARELERQGQEEADEWEKEHSPK